MENFKLEEIKTPKGLRYCKKCLTCGKSTFINKQTFESNNVITTPKQIKEEIKVIEEPKQEVKQMYECETCGYIDDNEEPCPRCNPKDNSEETEEETPKKKGFWEQILRDEED